MKRRERCRLVVLTVLATLSMALPAFALLQGNAGNTIIRNTATVSYSDAGGTAQTPVNSNQVQVTVTTVNVAPIIKSVSPASATTTGTGTTATYTVELVTNSNGPGTVTLGAVNGTATNTTPGAPAVSGGGTVFLGSSIIDPSDSNTAGLKTLTTGQTITFNIPNDNGVPTDAAISAGATGNNSVNALTNGDKVYLYDGATYYGPLDVTTVTDNAPGAGNTAAVSTILLTNSNVASVSFTLPAPGSASRWMIVELKTLTVTVTQGAITGAGPHWLTDLTPSFSNGTGSAAGTTTSVDTTATIASLTVNKYVRNATAAVIGGGGSATAPIAATGGATFYKTGVSGKPTDVMEYLFVINNSGSAAATKVVATDNVPTYTTLRSSSGGVYGADNAGGLTGTFAVARRDGVGGGIDQALKVDKSSGNNATAWGVSAGTTASSLMTLCLGNNSASAAQVGPVAACSGGDLAVGETAYVIYQVIIN